MNLLEFKTQASSLTTHRLFVGQFLAIILAEKHHIIDGPICLLSNFVENFMHRLNSHKDKGGGQEEA